MNTCVLFSALLMPLVTSEEQRSVRFRDADALKPLGPSEPDKYSPIPPCGYIEQQIPDRKVAPPPPLTMLMRWEL
jgi:hypothetical protein